MPDVDEILKLMRSPSRDETELITRAYAFSKTAHAGQKRYSGEPYFVHVFETAKNLAELGMGARTIAAGLLHDTIEDAQIKPEIIKNKFGEDILFLVEGVTKLGTIRYRGTKRHVESLRKLFLATSKDIRVLIIKLADRLHNMETLSHVPKGKQRRIALETMEVYAPIAHRLNMGRMRGELEDLSFPYLNPEEHGKVSKLAESKSKETIGKLSKIHKRLVKELGEEKITIVSTDYRKKHLYSLYRKLKRKDWDIDRVYDIFALRVIVSSVSDCYRVLGIVHSIWRPLPGRIKDYIAFPKPNGYQSIHTTVFTGEGGVAEIQIRTEKMHQEAEYGIASHFNYKNNKKSAMPNFLWFRDLYQALSRDSGERHESADIPDWLKEMAEEQKVVAGTEEFLENLRSDFFENRIFAFTPKGDVIDLPSGSSPIDFAYHIHTDIGHHIAGAKINGKMSSLDTKLKNGDIVEIVTKKSSKPSQKWLEYAKTTAAKRRIRAALNRRED